MPGNVRFLKNHSKGLTHALAEAGDEKARDEITFKFTCMEEHECYAFDCDGFGDEYFEIVPFSAKERHAWNNYLKLEAKSKMAASFGSIASAPLGSAALWSLILPPEALPKVDPGLPQPKKRPLVSPPRSARGRRGGRSSYQETVLFLRIRIKRLTYALAKAGDEKDRAWIEFQLTCMVEDKVHVFECGDEFFEIVPFSAAQRRYSNSLQWTVVSIASAQPGSAAPVQPVPEALPKVALTQPKKRPLVSPPRAPRRVQVPQWPENIPVRFPLQPKWSSVSPQRAPRGVQVPLQPKKRRLN